MLKFRGKRCTCRGPICDPRCLHKVKLIVITLLSVIAAGGSWSDRFTLRSKKIIHGPERAGYVTLQDNPSEVGQLPEVQSPAAVPVEEPVVAVDERHVRCQEKGQQFNRDYLQRLSDMDIGIPSSSTVCDKYDAFVLAPHSTLGYVFEICKLGDGNMMSVKMESFASLGYQLQLGTVSGLATRCVKYIEPRQIAQPFE